MAWIQGYECLECNQRIWWSSPQKCERPCENGDKWKRSFRMSRMCNIIPIRCTKMMALYEWPWGTKFSLYPSSIRYRCIWRFCYELSYCIVFLNIWYIYPQRRSIRKNHQKIGWYANLTWGWGKWSYSNNVYIWGQTMVGLCKGSYQECARGWSQTTPRPPPIHHPPFG